VKDGGAAHARGVADIPEWCGAGDLVFYSNFGTALAGLVVEDITGMPFAEYVERNIFQPLGMERSSFREPLPENLAPDMAVGYRRKAGLYEPGYFESSATLVRPGRCRRPRPIWPAS
jgi:CubicO group peptidase (beta-lactamase class C family)